MSQVNDSIHSERISQMIEITIIDVRWLLTVRQQISKFIEVKLCDIPGDGNAVFNVFPHQPAIEAGDEDG